MWSSPCNKILGNCISSAERLGKIMEGEEGQEAEKTLE